MTYREGMSPSDTKDFIMAVITRVQHVQYDNVSMLAVEGKGTHKFRDSGAPATLRNSVSAVFSGHIRITKSERAGGYFIIGLDRGRNADRRRMFFDGSAKVGIFGEVYDMDTYWGALVRTERILAALS